ncbi:hypothetical protein D9M71_305090 [compost metagenome]
MALWWRLMRRQQLEALRGDDDDARRVSGCGSARTRAVAEKPLADANAAKHRPDAVVKWHDTGRRVALPWPAPGHIDYLVASFAFARDPAGGLPRQPRCHRRVDSRSFLHHQP